MLNSRTLKGGHRPPLEGETEVHHQCSSRVGSTLPRPRYADVWPHIPMTHHNDAGPSSRNCDEAYKGEAAKLADPKGMYKDTTYELTH